MPYLHFGVRVPQLSSFLKTIIGAGYKAPFMDGDGWPVWGEIPGVHGNPEDVLHVLVPVRGTKMSDDIMRIVPETVKTPEGAIAYLTEMDNWTQTIKVYPRPLEDAKTEASVAIDTLYRGMIDFANEGFGSSVTNIIFEADVARNTLRRILAI